MDRPQKGTLWLWTTLWVTSFIDALLLFIVTVLLLRVIGLQSSMLNLGVVFVSYGIGAWLAARYIVRHSIVHKSQANKLAFLGILVPFVGATAIGAFIISHLISTGGTLSYPGIGLYVLQAAVLNGLIFIISRWYIQNYGDEDLQQSAPSSIGTAL